MLKLQGRKLSFQVCDRLGLHGERFFLQRQVGLKRRQSVPLLGGERIGFPQCCRELMNLGVFPLNESARVVGFLCCRGELSRRLRQGTLKCGDFVAVFAALPGKGEQIRFLGGDDCRPVAEFHHFGGMDVVEIFGLLLEAPLFDGEFGPQQVAPGEDFLGRKRKLHFEPPRGQSYGTPPKGRGDHESNKARDQKPKREYHDLFNHVPPCSASSKGHQQSLYDKYMRSPNSTEPPLNKPPCSWRDRRQRPKLMNSCASTQKVPDVLDKTIRQIKVIEIKSNRPGSKHSLNALTPTDRLKAKCVCPPSVLAHNWVP